MNTQLLKQRAIAKVLALMFEHTCMYGVSATSRWDTAMEPDEEAVYGFRNMLAELANEHHRGLLTKRSLKDCKEWVRQIGFEYGHVTGSYTTGVWGVRYNQFDELMTILDIPDGALLKVGTFLCMLDRRYNITEYRISAYGLSVYIEPQTPGEYPWSFPLGWHDIKDVMPGGKYDCDTN